MDIKEEDVVSQNETDLGTMKRNSDAFKIEIKSETPFTKHLLKEIKTEIATCSSNWGKDLKTEIEEQTLISDFDSQNEGEFLPENPVMKLVKLNNDHQIDKKTEIKSETPFTKDLLMHIKTEFVACSYPVSDDIKDGDFPPVKSSRLSTEAVSGASSYKPPLLFAEVPEREADFYNLKDRIQSECEKSNVTEMSTAKQHTEGGEIYIESLHLKQKYSIHKNKRHKCNICHKSFTRLVSLKRHVITPEGKKPYQCKTCGRSFPRLSNFKMHNLIHEGNKPHKCKICDRYFTRLSSLKLHSLIHEGKKPHQCLICDKSFTQLSNLKRHNWIHEGKKPYQCKSCDKSFTHLSTLKVHILTHEGKKPYECKSCDKRFTRLSTLKIHNLIHDSKKPHQCKTCDKSFTLLSNLKSHSFIHEGKKPHQCKTCM